MMCFMNHFAGKVTNQVFFYVKWSFGTLGHQAQSFGNPKNMCIHRHIGLVPNDTGDDIGRFSTYSG